ncbi:stage II sporulation protein P [Brevibacillus daliensis]|uniref:stage II sporulation protein P n=1 Tax=Brevibacillus daliensis TaxID=2892995 RepID=UPI001E60BE31|nr:stage II sporulation protein P [Brevibacillus daliensis]
MGTLLQRYFLLLSLGTAVLFVMISLLIVQTSQRDLLYSSSISRAASNLPGTMLLDVMGMEIPALHKTVQAQGEPEKSTVSSFFFQLATGIYPGDLRSLLGREIPGILTYEDARIIVPGQGLELKDLFVESAAPHGEIDTGKQEVLPPVTKPGPPNEDKKPHVTPPAIKNVFVYTTHNRESWSNVEGITKDVQHPKTNISLVSERLGTKLNEKGIGSLVNQSDIIQQLVDQNKLYPLAYAESFKSVKEAAKSNPSLQYYFDIHRDADIPRKKTAVTINGKTYARIMFVIGTGNRKYKENEKLAVELNKLVEEKYPGLSRGVIARGIKDGDGEYNQSFSSGSLLLEFGGTNNTLQEVYSTADAFAEVFADYYMQAEKVSKEQPSANGTR